MKFLFDFFPVLTFFIAFKVSDDDIIIATIAAMTASVIQVVGFWLKHRRFEKMHLIVMVTLLVMGSITIYLGDSVYIKWKTTIVEWAFGVILIGSQYIWKVNLIKKMMSQAMTAPEHIWARLNLAWASFFIFVGFLNIYGLYKFSTEDWVNFKTFGVMGMTIVFSIVTVLMLFRYVNKDDAATEAKENGEP